MIGTAELAKWRTVAADTEVDGVTVPEPEKIGQITEIIEARFAYKAEALEWAAGLMASGEGWDVPDGSGDGYGPGTAGLSSAAVSYFGPTDAPGNCWSMRLERIIEA